MLFCGLDSLIQDAVFVALIHWQGMMSWNSDNFDNSGPERETEVESKSLQDLPSENEGTTPLRVIGFSLHFLK